MLEYLGWEVGFFGLVVFFVFVGLGVVIIVLDIFLFRWGNELCVCFGWWEFVEWCWLVECVLYRMSVDVWESI